jgi:hypothetical protein
MTSDLLLRVVLDLLEPDRAQATGAPRKFQQRRKARMGSPQPGPGRSRRTKVVVLPSSPLTTAPRLNAGERGIIV